MMKIDNSRFHPDDLGYQDQQERQVAALRDFYPNTPNDRLRVVYDDEVEQPLELTRLYGPFALDVVQWAIMCKVTLGVDADGKEYVEY